MIAFPGKAKILPAKPEALLLDYQKNWVLDPARLKICEKSRQIGFTWATAYALARRHSNAKERLDTWVTSRDEEQAVLFVNDTLDFSKLLEIGATDLGERVLDEKNNSARSVRFDNSTRINSMSSNPNAQAGKRGHRVADEFGLHPDPRYLYKIMKPGVTWGGKLDIFSTHRGSLNYFNELIEEIKHKGNPKGFSLHTVTLQDALDCGFLYRLQERLAEIDPTDDRLQMDEAEYFDAVKNEMPDEESFLQEYMCVPSDDNSAFLSYDLITAAEYRPGTAWGQMAAGDQAELYIGVDVGRKHDLTCVWLLEKSDGMFFTRAVEVMQNVTFSEQEKLIWDLLLDSRVRRACFDSSGLGMQLAERAKERFGGKVEEIQFTAQVKEELAYPLRGSFEDYQVKIPSDPKIRSDLRAIKKEQTASGNVRFTADRGANGHADRFWALALALHGARHVPFAGTPKRFNLRGHAKRAASANRSRRVRRSVGV